MNQWLALVFPAHAGDRYIQCCCHPFRLCSAFQRRLRFVEFSTFFMICNLRDTAQKLTRCLVDASLPSPWRLDVTQAGVSVLGFRCSPLNQDELLLNAHNSSTPGREDSVCRLCFGYRSASVDLKPTTDAFLSSTCAFALLRARTRSASGGSQ